MNRTAIFSPCRKYRYRLGREWSDMLDSGKPGFVAFCMLNPSTADETQDDPTIRRCIAFANSWGWKRLVIVNLFALRATDPREMMKHPEPVGPENDSHIDEVAGAASLFVCAWGNDGSHQERASAVRWRIRSAGRSALRLGELTDKQQPRHPLYLKGDLQPVLL
jgi:hypothetical protein